MVQEKERGGANLIVYEEERERRWRGEIGESKEFGGRE